VDASALSPAQRLVVDDLLALGQPRPTFPDSLWRELLATLEDGLAPALDGQAEPIWVTKGTLAQVHGCERRFVAERQFPFEWTARTALGTVTHKAIELSVTAPGHTPPLALVDRAIEVLAGDDRRTSPAPFLRAATAMERAELKAAANDVVAKFLECWPPLAPAWAPRTETGIGADLCGGQVVLWARVDLALGRARGNEARGLIVDVKTGRPYPGHVDDLRFYALVQTLRTGVPPFRTASSYLDTGRFHAEDVTADILRSAARRVIDGVAKLVELGQLGPGRGEGRPPTISPGPACHWCVERHRCPGPAQADGADRGTRPTRAGSLGPSWPPATASPS
jgi:PD-(D/E)XK nuclease superfamily